MEENVGSRSSELTQEIENRLNEVADKVKNNTSEK